MVSDDVLGAGLVDGAGADVAEAAASGAGAVSDGAAREGGADEGAGGKETGAARETETGRSPAGVDVAALKLPEGFAFSQELAGEVGAKLSAAGVSQEAAQELVDLHCRLVNEAREAGRAAYDEMIEGWKAELRRDAEIGGARLAENLSYGNRLLREFGSPELNELMADGLNVHPAMVRFLVKVGRAFAEDRFVDPMQRGGARGVDAVASSLFARSLGR